MALIGNAILESSRNCARGIKIMRYSSTLFLAASSALTVAIACVAQSAPAAFASEPSANIKIAALAKDSGATQAQAQKVICSRNRPLQYSDVTKVASASNPQGLGLASNIIQLFCRDVRINTILVRDYCAIIRE
jgi:hypothetical protein